MMEKSFCRLNCLSAGSVSLTPNKGEPRPVSLRSQLPFGWVCFSNYSLRYPGANRWKTSQLPFGWVCFSNTRCAAKRDKSVWSAVSIAFRLGLFL